MSLLSWLFVNDNAEQQQIFQKDMQLHQYIKNSSRLALLETVLIQEDLQQ